jgi:tetratricopeptide (TPR) repeat protein
MKSKREAARASGCCRAVLAVSCTVAAGWSTSTTQAQASNFAPASIKTEARVSVRELKVPSKAKGEFEQGLQRLAKRDSAGSLQHFDAAVRVYPGYYEVYYHQGIAQLQLRNNEEALRCFQKAIDLSEGRYAAAEFGYGLALLREGEVEEAERVVRHGLEADPDSVDGHVVLGFVLLKLDRPDEAEKQAREAIGSNATNSAKGYLVLSDVAAAAGNYDRQVRDLDTYLKLRPNDPNKKMLQRVRDLAKRLAAKTRLTASK